MPPPTRPLVDRREFLKSAAATAAVFASPSLLGGCAPSAAVLHPPSGDGKHSLTRIGLQLYTVRQMMERDPVSTLAAISKAGYAEVEFAGLYGHSAPEMRSLIDRFGLSSPAGHVSIQELRANLPQLVDDAEALGWQWLIVPWIDRDERTVKGYRRIAADFNRAGAAARKYGIKIGFHAEDYDFQRLPDGTIPYDLVLEATEPGLVDMELDLYWIAKGGGNALGYLARYPGRFPLLHLKDLTASGEMANVGEGAIDFRAILARATIAGSKHFIVENDEPKNPLADITAGIRYLERLRW